MLLTCLATFAPILTQLCIHVRMFLGSERKIAVKLCQYVFHGILEKKKKNNLVPSNAQAKKYNTLKNDSSG